MMNKLFILLMFVGLLAVQSMFAQSVRPLGITIETRANFDNAEWRWTPMIGFRILGPIESGSQIVVDFTLPNGSPFVTLKCETPRLEEGKNTRIGSCGFNNPDDSKATNQQGLFGFKIKLNNAVSGQNKVLYAGKFNVGRILYNPDGSAEKNKQFYYFVDNDWRLNYAYIGTFYGDTSNNLYAQIWVKNRIQNKADITGYLFYNGKQVSETSPSYELESYPKENSKQEYTMLGLNFQALMAKPESAGWDGVFKVYENPGDYEVKLLRDKKLVRSIKFSIGSDGKPVSNGVGKELINEGAIVPAQILGEVDGVFNKAAWKDGVWGNPISGLIVP